MKDYKLFQIGIKIGKSKSSKSFRINLVHDIVRTSKPRVLNIGTNLHPSSIIDWSFPSNRFQLKSKTLKNSQLGKSSFTLKTNPLKKL